MSFPSCPDWAWTDRFWIWCRCPVVVLLLVDSRGSTRMLSQSWVVWSWIWCRCPVVMPRWSLGTTGACWLLLVVVVVVVELVGWRWAPARPLAVATHLPHSREVVVAAVGAAAAATTITNYYYYYWCFCCLHCKAVLHAVDRWWAEVMRWQVELKTGNWNWIDVVAQMCPLGCLPRGHRAL